MARAGRKTGITPLTQERDEDRATSAETGIPDTEVVASRRASGQKTGMAGRTGGTSQWMVNSGAVNLARCHDLAHIQAIRAELAGPCLADGPTRVPLGGIAGRRAS